MRGLGIILAAALGASVALGGPAGYLPKVGPVLLRFQTQRPVVRVELPPLELPAPLPSGPRSSDAAATLPSEPADVGSQHPPLRDPDAAATQPMEPDPVALGSSTGEVVSVPANLLNQASTNSPAPAPDSKSEDLAFLSPQMFLRFFTPAGSGVGREVVVPVPPGFNPAQPGQPVASSATYTLSKP